MAAESTLFARFRRWSPTNVIPAAAPENRAETRSPEQMIAGCEYELRQLRRDVLQTRQRPAAPPAIKPAEPFVLGAGLRGRAAG